MTNYPGIENLAELIADKKCACLKKDNVQTIANVLHILLDN